MSVVAPRSVEAIIVDDAGTVVAQRTLTDRSAKVCLPLARAVGAWASLVLDAELARAKDDDGSEPTPTLATTPPTTTSAISPTVDGQGPPPSRDRASSSDGEGASARDERHAIDLGTMVTLRNGMTATGGFAGVTPFIAIEVAPSMVLRPALAFGRSTSSISESSGMSHVGVRADFCRRVPGNYIERRGIEADLCFGVETGVIASDAGSTSHTSTAGRLGLGPAATLRGELGAGLALEVRGLLGANLLDKSVGGTGAAPLVFAAGELGVSVRLP